MFELLMSAALRVTVLLSIVWLAATVLRRRSAALRHALWAVGLLGALAVPFVELAPALPILPSWETPVAVTEPLDPPSPIPAKPTEVVASGAPSAGPAPEPIPSSPPGEPFPWRQLVVALWALGFAVLVARLMLATVVVRRMTRSAAECDDAGVLAAWAEAGKAVSTNASLRVSDGSVGPLTCGVFRPVVIVPKSTSAWHPTRLRAVFVHELAHAARRDCFVQLLVRVARAAYWFHPLAWLAAHRVHVEQERACDDVVLRSGVRASSYVEDLLEISKKLEPAPAAALVSTAIARPSELVLRMKYLLESGRVRGLVTRRARVALVATGASLCWLVGASEPVAVARVAIEPDDTVERQDPKAETEQQKLARRLVGILDLESHRKQTVRELIRLGEVAVPYLLEALIDDDEQVVDAAVDALARIRPKSLWANLAVWEVVLQNSESGRIRRIWPRVTSQVEADEKGLAAVESVFAAALSGNSIWLDHGSAFARVAAGAGARLIELAAPLLGSVNPKVARFAATVIANVREPSATRFRLLLDALGHDDTEVVRMGVYGLVLNESDREAAIGKLRALQGHHDEEVRRSATRAVTEVGRAREVAELATRTDRPPEWARQRVLIADYSQNRIVEVDRAGNTTFVIEKIYGAWDAEPLANGNLLITEFALNSVKEITRDGKEVWLFEDLENPNDADALPNGNVLIADTFGDRVIEVNQAGEIVWSYDESIKPYDVERLANGNTLIADGRKDRIIEVSPAGGITWQLDELSGVHDVDRLPNGNTLIVQRTEHRVAELDPDGKVVWVIQALASPSDADRLPDGNTIVAENGRVSEYDRNGKLVWTTEIAWAVEVNVIDPGR